MNSIMNFEELAIAINCEEIEIKETDLSTTVIFYMSSLADVHKGVRTLQSARYPAVNGKGHTIVMTLQNYNIDTDLLLDYYNDIAKVNCVGPRDSLQKNVDFRFEIGETTIRDKSNKNKQPKLKRKLQTDDTFRRRKGVYKFVGDYSTSI